MAICVGFPVRLGGENGSNVYPGLNTLAPAAEMILPKNRILELYLNEIEWGPGVYGAEAAARSWYGVSAARLTRDQAERLAAVIPSPLHRKPDRMNWYAGEIDRRMTQTGW